MYLSQDFNGIDIFKLPGMFMGVVWVSVYYVAITR